MLEYSENDMYVRGLRSDIDEAMANGQIPNGAIIEEIDCFHPEYNRFIDNAVAEASQKWNNRRELSSCLRTLLRKIKNT